MIRKIKFVSSETKQCKPNVTLKHVHVTIISVEKPKGLQVLIEFLIHCLNYPEFKARALYYIVTVFLSGSAIFFQVIS